MILLIMGSPSKWGYKGFDAAGFRNPIYEKPSRSRERNCSITAAGSAPSPAEPSKCLEIGDLHSSHGAERTRVSVVYALLDSENTAWLQAAECQTIMVVESCHTGSFYNSFHFFPNIP